MSSPAITADSQTDVLAALALMTQRRIRHLPVVEGGEIRGIVSIGDLVKYRMERIEAEAEAMRELHPERLKRVSRKSFENKCLLALKRPPYALFR